MSAPLTNGQKAYLAQLATRAFNRAAALARGRGETVAEDRSSQEKWRHDQVALATGKLGLRCCDQADYKLVEAHFLEMLGQHGRAFNAQVRAATESRRLIEFKITEACKEFGFSISYANKICTVQNRGASLDEVDEKKLWQLFYTIRNRGLAKQRKEREAQV